MRCTDQCFVCCAQRIRVYLGLVSCRRLPRAILRRDQRADHSVQIVEERQQIDGQFDPAFLLAERQNVRVHDARGIVQTGIGHHRAINVPGKKI